MSSSWSSWLLRLLDLPCSVTKIHGNLLLLKKEKVYKTVNVRMVTLNSYLISAIYMHQRLQPITEYHIDNTL